MMQNNNEVLLMSSWIKPDWATWQRVILIGRDRWATTTLRHFLAWHGAVRLRKFDDIPSSQEDMVDADLVIWLRVRNDGLPELAGYVAALRRKLPAVRQLVISDAVPRGLVDIPCPISGVWLARADVGIDNLYGLLCRIMMTAPSRAPLLTLTLSCSQLRVMLLRSAGVDTDTIAQMCGIGLKTLSVHESAIRKRFGLTNRAEYVWLLRSVRLMQIAVPGLRRHARRLHVMGK